MIQFHCNCGNRFSLDNDQAGGTVQCTRCGRLNDVPTHSDLPNLADDGTFKLAAEPDPVREDPVRVEELAYVFQKTRVDDDGHEIDLRNTPEEMSGVDNPPYALEPGEQPKYAPQYDPETGELVRPLDVKADAGYPGYPDAPYAGEAIDPNSIPLAKPAALNYARPMDLPGVSSGGVYLALFQPANVSVMAFVLLAHVIGAVLHIFITFPAALFHLPAWPFNVLFWLTCAHYGNVVFETGPEAIDELPRPLRSLALWDDVLGPMIRVLLAVLLCYFPAFAVLTLFEGATRIVALPLLLAGGFFLPAILLTTTTSGSLLNLRLDRVLNVIRVGGKQYRRLAVVWVLTFPVYLWATLGVDLVGSSLNKDLGDSALAGKIFVAGPAALLAVYFMHYFCWQLGLLYRAGHYHFGWVWQEMQREREAKRLRGKEAAALDDANRAVARHQRELQKETRRAISRAAGTWVG